jgi:hypothetical protein
VYILIDEDKFKNNYIITTTIIKTSFDRKNQKLLIAFINVNFKYKNFGVQFSIRMYQFYFHAIYLATAV